ncbi:FG-GAP repeat protein [Streptomyces sp. NPDC007907]|uniref:FG-GAP repeat protein n=1 Tax=Streptomyces sp. NPDC007907 TaxID=3364789 RepID=UPI0036E91E5F
MLWGGEWECIAVAQRGVALVREERRRLCDWQSTACDAVCIHHSVLRGGENELTSGTSVAVGDINGDGKPGLLLSAAEESASTGAVWGLSGGTSGPRGSGLLGVI